jgi:hypothetical protein
MGFMDFGEEDLWREHPPYRPNTAVDQWSSRTSSPSWESVLVPESSSFSIISLGSGEWNECSQAGDDVFTQLEPVSDPEIEGGG